MPYLAATVSVMDYLADPTGVNDSTTAINQAIAAVSASGGGVVSFPAGTFKVSSAVNLASYVSLVGAGSGVTVINQTSTSANGLSGTDLTNTTVRQLSVTGPSSGSGIGISLGLSVNNDSTYIDIINVRVAAFGSHGIQIQSPETCRFDRVNVSSCGGDGWHIYGTGTSCKWGACYSLSNTGGFGYHLIGLSYSSLASCAADSNADGYSLSGCTNVALTGCGTEMNTVDGYVLSGGSGNSLTSCFIYGINHYGVHVTGSESNATVEGFVEHSPTGSAVNSILVDAGTSAAVINPSVITAASYAAGTTYQVTPYGASGQMWTPEDNGLLVANGDPWATQATSSLLTAGTVYLYKLVIRRNMTISNVWFLLNTAGTGTSTGSFAGLYSSAGTLLSGSSDIASKVVGVTPPATVEVPLTTPQAVTAGTFVWVALMSNLSSSQPGLHQANSSALECNVNLAAATYRFATNGTGTSLPGTITPGSNAQTSANTIWVGAS